MPRKPAKVLDAEPVLEAVPELATEPRHLTAVHPTPPPAYYKAWPGGRAEEVCPESRSRAAEEPSRVPGAGTKNVIGYAAFMIGRGGGRPGGYGHAPGADRDPLCASIRHA